MAFVNETPKFILSLDVKKAKIVIIIHREYFELFPVILPDSYHKM